jgi:hypothetical protein
VPTRLQTVQILVLTPPQRRAGYCSSRFRLPYCCFGFGWRELQCEARAKAPCQVQGVDSGQQSITPTRFPCGVKDSLSHTRRPSRLVTTVSACKAVAASKTRIKSRFSTMSVTW